MKISEFTLQNECIDSQSTILHVQKSEASNESGDIIK